MMVLYYSRSRQSFLGRNGDRMVKESTKRVDARPTKPKKQKEVTPDSKSRFDIEKNKSDIKMVSEPGPVRAPYTSLTRVVRVSTPTFRMIDDHKSGSRVYRNFNTSKLLTLYQFWFSRCIQAKARYIDDHTGKQMSYSRSEINTQQPVITPGGWAGFLNLIDKHNPEFVQKHTSVALSDDSNYPFKEEYRREMIALRNHMPLVVELVNVYGPIFCPDGTVGGVRIRPDTAGSTTLILQDQFWQSKPEGFLQSQTSS